MSERDQVTQIVRRLKSIEGHVRGIAGMVQQDQYCIDVMNQILAVQRALDRVGSLVLDHHLHTCVTSVLRGQSGKERERVIDEILEVFRSKGKR